MKKYFVFELKKNLLFQNKKLFLFFFVFFFSCNNFSRTKEQFTLKESYADTIESKIKVNLFYLKKEFSLFDNWKLQVMLEYPPIYTTIRPYLPNLTYKPLELIEDPLEETTFDKKNQLFKRNFLYNFTALETGKHQIKPLIFNFQNIETNQIIQIKTIQIKLNITDNEVENFKEIQTIIQKKSYKGIIFIIIIAVSLIIIIILRSKLKTTPKQEVDLIALSLKELYKLKHKQYLKREKIKFYHLELSRILRKFLEKKYLFKAEKQTTTEFLESIQNYGEIKKYRDLLQKYLEMNNLAKFANYQPDQPANLEIFDLVKQIILSSNDKN